MTLTSLLRFPVLITFAVVFFPGSSARGTIGPSDTADIYAIAVDPTAPATLYAGTRNGGIYKTTDGGQSWTPASAGIIGSIYSNIALDPTDPEKLYLGTDGGGFFRTTDGGHHWIHGEGSYHQTVKSISIDAVQANVITMGAFRDIYRSFDYGATWGILYQFDFATGVLSIAQDPVSTNAMYIATNTHGLMKSIDGGYTWNRTAVSQISTVVAIDPADNQAVLASGFNNLVKSTDSGATWRTTLDVPYGSAIVFDAANPGSVYASFGYNGVYASNDGGETWSPANAGLPTLQINALAIDSANGILYAGTEGAGIFVSYDGGQTWM